MLHRWAKVTLWENYSDTGGQWTAKDAIDAERKKVFKKINLVRNQAVEKTGYR